jgi:mannose-6-phosphate isomerase-like protein (cupin superfamily)
MSRSDPFRASQNINGPCFRHSKYYACAMDQMQRKNLSQPDEKRGFDKGELELVTVGGVTFGRVTLQPGWKWSTCVKPIAKTESCQAPHLQYHISGRIHVVMDDGSEMDFGPGDVSLLPPGHDAWVVGDEPVVAIDIQGMTHYAEPPAKT